MVLMKDLLGAFKSKQKEYYLQYITVKKSTFEGIEVLEVIDGQQRLTTLSLIFAVLAHHLSDSSLAHDKLIYGVRDKVNQFFKVFIYDDIEQLLEGEIKSFTDDHEEWNEQDIYYLYHAIRRIDEELSDVKYLDFQKYISERILIILNLVEPGVSSERIFSNLNNNKVELTGTELIKGLLLTRAGRESANPGGPGFREVMELRSAMGRQWDEIARWVKKKEIASFYFPGVNDEMLMMLQWMGGMKKAEAVKPTHANIDKEILENPFNYFDGLIKTGTETASELFSRLKLLQAVLREWYETDEIYNLLGFLFVHHKKFHSRIFILSLIEKPTSELKSELQDYIKKLVPWDVKKLNYHDDKEMIRRILLALSIFGTRERFDFHSFSKGGTTWSLEHIFPQNPKALPEQLRKNDLKLIKSLRSDGTTEFDLEKFVTEENSLEDFEEAYSSLCEKLKQETCTLTEREKYLLYKMIKMKDLNSIGNMALLKLSDNISNGNGMFDKKRRNIAKRVSEGSFVPKHTYDVFSKLIHSAMIPDLTLWTAEDIKLHADWIESKAKGLFSGNHTGE